MREGERLVGKARYGMHKHRFSEHTVDIDETGRVIVLLIVSVIEKRRGRLKSFRSLFFLDFKPLHHQFIPFFLTFLDTSLKLPFLERLG